MESNFIFNLSGTMIKLDDGELFQLNDDCLVETTVYKSKFEQSLSDKTLFDEKIIQQLLKGKTLLEVLLEGQTQDICIVDIENEDGFFDGRCQKISMIHFLERYILDDKQTYVLNKKALSEVLGETHFFVETKESFFIKKVENFDNMDDSENEYNDETLYSDDMTINFDKKSTYQSQKFQQQSMNTEPVDKINTAVDEKHQDILKYSYEKAPVLETNEETDDVLPLTDNQEDAKDICDNVMIKDAYNNDVMKAKDLVIEKRCFSSRHSSVSEDILLPNK